MKRLTATILAIALTTGCAFCQIPVWGLDSCVEYAVSHSSAILLQRCAERASRASLEQSRMELLPTLNIYVNQYYNWGRSVDMQELVIVRNRLTLQTSGSIGAQFLIFDGFTRLSAIARDKYLASAAASDVRQAMIDVKADITAAYLGNILAVLTKERLRESLDLVGRQAERVSHQVSCGARARSDLLEMEARRADILAQIAAAQGEEALRMEELRSLMGCTELFTTDTSLKALPCLPYCTDDIPLHLVPPSVTALKNRLSAAEYGLKAARGALLPTLSVSAAYGTYYSDASSELFKDQLDGNRNPSVSLSLVIPILNGGKTSGAIASARAEVESSRLRLQQAREQASLYEERLGSELANLAGQLDAARSRRGFCRERLRECTDRYEAGALPATDWLDAAREASQAECECVQCLCKYLFQLKLIEYYRDGCR